MINEKKIAERQFMRAYDYFCSEYEINAFLEKKSRRKNSFCLLDKDWITKWKEIIWYNQIKEKLGKYHKSQPKDEEIKKEIIQSFLDNNIAPKIEQLGKMDKKKCKK